jgi:hypothetical protein
MIVDVDELQFPRTRGHHHHHRDCCGVAILYVPLVDVRPPVRPDIGANHAAPGADHALAERAHGQFIR